jgi:hypothetical protein
VLFFVIFSIVSQFISNVVFSISRIRDKILILNNIRLRRDSNPGADAIDVPGSNHAVSVYCLKNLILSCDMFTANVRTSGSQT